MATLVGLEPMTSAVTGRRSNQLSYSAIAVWHRFATRRECTLPKALGQAQRNQFV